MDKTYYLKTATQLKDSYHIPVQIIDLAETSPGELTVYIKKGEKTDLRQFKDDLSAALGLRVEVLVLGSREVASLIGGIGRCDQELCCHRFLNTPLNITTQTIANQDLRGIPSDYLGMCGKLLCCLLYESENFKLECAFGESLRSKLKKESDEIQRKVAEVKTQMTPRTAEVKKEEHHRKVIRRFIK